MPDTAAKIVQPMMLVCSSRPGSRSSHGARPRNMSSDSRVRNRISPIQTNSGSAVSVHDDAVPQIVTAIASPAGREREELHADPRDAGEREPDPHAAAEQHEQRDDEERGDECVHGPAYFLLVVQRCGRSARARAARAIPRPASSTNAISEDERPGRHRELRDPQRRRVVAGRDVVEVPRLLREPDAVEREQRGEQRCRPRATTARARGGAFAPTCSRSSVTRMCSPRLNVCASARNPAAAMQ